MLSALILKAYSIEVSEVFLRIEVISSVGYESETRRYILEFYKNSVGVLDITIKIWNIFILKIGDIFFYLD